MVEHGAFSHKIDYVTIFMEILNQNYITRLKVTAIWLNGWILHIGGVALGRVCAQPAKQACFLFNIRHKKLCVSMVLFLRQRLIFFNSKNKRATQAADADPSPLKLHQ